MVEQSEERFILHHQSDWRALESEVRSKRQSFQGADQFDRFIVLYRRVSADLAYAQTHFPGRPVTGFLNELVATAHHRLYRTRETGIAKISSFFAGELPRRFRESGAHIALAAFISLFAALFGYIATRIQPLQALALLPSSIAGSVHPSQAGPHAVDSPMLSSLIMTHNMVVALSAFLGGITLGLYTLYAMWQNGLMIGVLAAIFQTHERSTVFWSLIVPHGVTELLAIFIAGGAGLLFAHSLVSPGPYSRATAIRLALRRSVGLMLGTVPMFVIAGTIEGFVTPSGLPVWVKFGVAILTAALWTLYFGLVGRRVTKHSGLDAASRR